MYEEKKEINRMVSAPTRAKKWIEQEACLLSQSLASGLFIMTYPIT